MRAFVLVFSERVWILLATFLANAALANFLDVDQFGSYKWLMSSLSIFGLIGYFSLEAILIRFIPEMRRERDRRLIRVLGFCFVIRATTISLVSAALIGYQSLAFSPVSNDPALQAKIAYYFIIILSLTSFSSLLGRAFITAIGKRHQVAIIVTLYESVKLISILFFMNSDAMGLVDLLKILAYVEALFLVIYILQFISFFSLITKHLSQRRTNALLTRISKFGFANWIASGGQSMRHITMDTFMLGILSSASTSAIYAIAATLPNLARNFSPYRIFSGILIPKIVQGSTTSVEDYFSHHQSNFRLVEKIILFAFIPCALFIGSISNDLIELAFSKKYSMLGPLSQLLMLTVILVCLADVFYIKGQILEKNAITAKVTGYTGLGNLALNLFLIPLYGAWGAAWATLSAATAGLIMFHLYFRKEKSYYLFSAKYYGSAICQLITIWFVINLIPYQCSLIARLAYPMVILVFALALFIKLHFSSSEIQQLKDKVTKGNYSN